MIAFDESNDRFLSMTEAADLLAFNEKTIRRYIADGRLTGYRIGPRILRVRRSEVLALVEQVPTQAVSA